MLHCVQKMEMLTPLLRRGVTEVYLTQLFYQRYYQTSGFRAALEPSWLANFVNSIQLKLNLIIFLAQLNCSNLANRLDSSFIRDNLVLVQTWIDSTRTKFCSSLEWTRNLELRKNGILNKKKYKQGQIYTRSNKKYVKPR